jgi:hypothetical protein
MKAHHRRMAEPAENLQLAIVLCWLKLAYYLPISTMYYILTHVRSILVRTFSAPSRSNAPSKPLLELFPLPPTNPLPSPRPVPTPYQFRTKSLSSYLIASPPFAPLYQKTPGVACSGSYSTLHYSSSPSPTRRRETREVRSEENNCFTEPDGLQCGTTF